MDAPPSGAPNRTPERLDPGSRVIDRKLMSPRLLRPVLAALAGAALLLCGSPQALATSRSGNDSRPDARAVLSATSPFSRRLPADTPAAPDSAQLVASLVRQAHQYYGTPEVANVGVNTVRFAPALYVAYNSDPVHDVVGWNCQNKYRGWDTGLNAQLKGVHIPVDMQPDDSTDGSASIYNADTGELVELWKARKVDGQWQACWGGRIEHADRSDGAFTYPYGTSASGLALWGGTIRQKELLEGRINHVVSLGIPHTKKGSVSWPANRTDGWVAGTELSIGQMLRLPASLDLAAMKLSPAARTIARAAQEYGIVIVDTSGSVAFSAENAVALADNRYDEVFRGRWPFLELQGDKARGEVPFPLDKLVALPLDYAAPTGAAATAPSPTAAPTPAPNAGYAAAVAAARPVINWRFDDTGSVAKDATGARRVGTLAGVSRTAEGAIRGSAAITTRGTRSSLVYQKSAMTPGRAFTVQVWFRTATRTGGKIAGFESARTGNGSRHDRSLYLTDAGRLVFGTRDGRPRTLTSPASYADGAWHQATATQSGDGTRLYVDGKLVAKNSTRRAQAGSGYWRLGGGNLAGWPSRPSSSYFAGSVDEFAYYGSALSAATIAAQYRAAA